jgi:ATP-binding cassette subfamily F protein 3
LDEPTTHLDLPARESLEEALKAFDGTVLFVSHDRYFIRALAGKMIELENGALQSFNGSYDEYTAYKNTLKASVQPTPTPSVSTKPDKNEGHYRSKEERAEDARRRTRIKKIEEEISALEEEDEELNAALATPEVAGNFALLTEKCTRLDEIKTLLDKLYEEYETLI